MTITVLTTGWSTPIPVSSLGPDIYTARPGVGGAMYVQWSADGTQWNYFTDCSPTTVMQMGEVPQGAIYVRAIAVRVSGTLSIIPSSIEEVPLTVYLLPGDTTTASANRILIQNALNACYANGGGTVTVYGAGDCYIDSFLSHPSNTRFTISTGCNLRLYAQAYPTPDGSLYCCNLTRNNNVGKCNKIIAEGKSLAPYAALGVKYGLGSIQINCTGTVASYTLQYKAPGDATYGTAVQVGSGSAPYGLGKYKLVAADGVSLCWVYVAPNSLNSGAPFTGARQQDVRVNNTSPAVPVTWIAAGGTVWVTEPGHQRVSGDAIEFLAGSGTIVGCKNVAFNPCISGDTWAVYDTNIADGFGSGWVWGTYNWTIDGGGSVDQDYNNPLLVSTTNDQIECGIFVNGASRFKLIDTSARHCNNHAIEMSNLAQFKLAPGAGETYYDYVHLNAPYRRGEVNFEAAATSDNMLGFGLSDYPEFLSNIPGVDNCDAEDIKISGLWSLNTVGAIRIYGADGCKFRNISLEFGGGYSTGLLGSLKLGTITNIGTPQNITSISKAASGVVSSAGTLPGNGEGVKIAGTGTALDGNVYIVGSSGAGVFTLVGIDTRNLAAITTGTFVTVRIGAVKSPVADGGLSLGNDPFVVSYYSGAVQLTGNAAFNFDGITIKNMGAQQWPWSAVDSSTVSLRLGQGSQARGLRFENCVFFGGNVNRTFAFSIYGYLDQATPIEDITFVNPQLIAGARYPFAYDFIRINAPGTGAVTIKKLNIIEPKGICPVDSSYNFGYLVKNDNVNCVIDQLTITNPQMRDTSPTHGGLIYNAGTINSIDINGGVVDGYAFVVNNNAGTLGNITVRGLRFESTYILINGTGTFASFNFSDLSGAVSGLWQLTSTAVQTIPVSVKGIQGLTTFQDPSSSSANTKIEIHAPELKMDGLAANARLIANGNAEFWHNGASSGAFAAGIGRYICSNAGTWTKVV